MSKIQTPVKPTFYFELGGKDRPCRFDYQAQTDLSDDFEADTVQKMAELPQRLGPRDLPKLLQRGLQGGARKEGLPTDITEKQAKGWLDEYDGILFGDDKGLFATLVMAYLDALPPHTTNGAEGKGKKATATNP